MTVGQIVNICFEKLMGGSLVFMEAFSTDVQKGHCAICNQISTVAFF